VVSGLVRSMAELPEIKDAFDQSNIISDLFKENPETKAGKLIKKVRDSEVFLDTAL